MNSSTLRMLVPLLLFIYSCWIGLFWFCHYLGCLVGFGTIFRVVVGLLVFRLLFYIGWVFAGVQKVRVFCKIWKRVIQALVNFGDSSISFDIDSLRLWSNRFSLRETIDDQVRAWQYYCLVTLNSGGVFLLVLMWQL